ncbi:hypothetical protein ACFL27_01320 [candidate division CSSED10-310 bacterium]|uniref:Uncharacterized protein n=1 Tax=candidate division CSSED10-310 bacterium TaxID=2855610 RepID=A0ABV6YRT6_UNCC1
MKDDETLKKLIGQLVEALQDSIQESLYVQDVLQKIEENGFALNLSMLIGIFLKDKDGVNMIFSSSEPGDELESAIIDHLLSDNTEKISSPAQDSIPAAGIWTDKDIEFLKSLGIRFDSDAVTSE